MVYFAEQDTHTKSKIKVLLDQNLNKKQTGVDTSKFAKKADLAGFKSETYKLEDGKLKNYSMFYSKLKNCLFVRLNSCYGSSVCWCALGQFYS